MKWLKDEIDILFNNYTEKGVDYCANQLNKKRRSVIYKANSLGLKTKIIIKKESSKKNKVNYNLFSDDMTKESVYILGLLWADGHIRCESKSTIINCVMDDLFNVLGVFKTTGDWNISNPINKDTESKKYKTQLRISTTTWGLYNILEGYDYLNKSISSPDKLLDEIPNDLKNYFFRGYLDGDGCIKLGKKYGVDVVFTGTINQSWDFMVNLCNQLNISYSIDRRNITLGGYSHFRVNKKLDVKVLCDYIYTNYSKDGIGFTRKYEKYMDVLSYIKNKSKLFWSTGDTNFLIKNYRAIGGPKCAIKLNRNIISIHNKVRQLKKHNKIV